MTFGSLFTGVGGIDLGLERAGFQCRWQIENEPYCVKVLKKHWPEVKRYGDIREVTGDELVPVDLLAGGFPCQDLSQAGKRTGIEGTRSGLWFEFARIIGVVRPRYVLIENVPGLLVPDAMRRVVGVLARCGYVGCWRSLRASEFGASHLRKRVFIIAHLAHTGIRRGRGREVAAHDNRGRGIGAEEEGTGPEAFRRNGSASGHGATLADTGNGQFPQQRRGPQGGDGIGSTGAMPFAPGPNDPRWPSILAERPDLAPALPQIRGMADGVPDWMDRAMSNRTKRLGRLGNAVVPDCAEWIGRKILEFEKSYASL